MKKLTYRGIAYQKNEGAAATLTRVLVRFLMFIVVLFITKQITITRKLPHNYW